jgi:hypothetical protein
MRRIDDIHAFAVFDLLAWHTNFLEDLMRRSTDRRLVHQIAAVPEPAAQRKALLDDDGAEAHVRQIMRANETRRTGTDDDDVAFDQLVEFFVVLARDLPVDAGTSGQPPDAELTVNF